MPALKVGSGGIGGLHVGATAATRAYLGSALVWESFDPLSAFAWKAVFWAEDPLWTPPADGGAVASWRDAGSEGKNAVQATGTKQPAYRASVAALNGQPAIQGDGVDDFLQTAAWSSALTQPRSLVVIGAASGSNRNLVDGIALGNRTLLKYNSGSAIWEINSGTSITGGTADTDPHLFVAVYNGASSALDVDGTEAFTGDAGANTGTGLTISANYPGTGAFNGGHIAFAGVIAGDVTAEANWSAFVAWVESHYGLSIA